MDEETLSPEAVERVRRQVLQEHPEMEGATVQVRLRRPSPDSEAIAEKLGLPAPKEPTERQYVVTLRKEVETEDGFRIPLVVRLTVDRKGQVVGKHERR